MRSLHAASLLLVVGVLLCAAAPAFAGQQVFKSVSSGKAPNIVPTTTLPPLLEIYPPGYDPCYRPRAERTTQQLHYRCCPYEPIAPSTIPSGCYNLFSVQPEIQSFGQYAIPPLTRQPLLPSLRRMPLLTPGFDRRSATPQAMPLHFSAQPIQRYTPPASR